MDKVIATMLMIVAGITAVVIAVNAIYPAVMRSSNSIVQAAGQMDARIGTQVSVVLATGELNSSGVWVDTDSDGYFDVTVWIKNVSTMNIQSIGDVDVFFGQQGSVVRIPYTMDAGASYPQWNYSLENGSEWTNTVTLKLSIHYTSALASGTYTVKVVTPSGAYTEQSFSF